MLRLDTSTPFSSYFFATYVGNATACVYPFRFSAHYIGTTPLPYRYSRETCIFLTDKNTTRGTRAIKCRLIDEITHPWQSYFSLPSTRKWAYLSSTIECDESDFLLLLVMKRWLKRRNTRTEKSTRNFHVHRYVVSIGCEEGCSNEG